MSLNNVSQTNNRELYANSIHSNQAILATRPPESFSVFNSVAQNISLNNTPVNLIEFPFSQVVSSNFNNSTNVYTIPTTGYYLFFVNIGYEFDNDPNAAFEILTTLIKNNTIVIGESIYYPVGLQGAATPYGETQMVVYEHFIAGEFLEVIASVVQSTNVTSAASEGTNTTWTGFQISQGPV